MTTATYVAKPYVAGTPQAEVVGQVVQAFSSNLRADLIEPILPRYGFATIDPEAWYPHQNWLNVLKAVEEERGTAASETFVAFGMEVVSTAVMPPELDDVNKVLHALHAIHHANLRNIPEAEGYEVVDKSEGHVWVYHNTPNPEDTIYGFIYALVQRYRAEGDNFLVERIDDPSVEGRARSLYDIRWGPQV